MTFKMPGGRFYVAAIVFACRACRRGRGIGFWVLAALMVTITVMSLIAFPMPLYLGR